MLVLRQCYHEGADHDVKGDWLVPISGVLRRIEDNLNYLSLSEKKVAQWILDHPHEVLTMTVKEVAHHAQSSQAAVTRCCHTLQVDGFGQLKVLLTADLVREELLQMAKEELPHSIATVVSEWDPPLVRVEILVERESQKPIVIGKGGEILKAVGIAVRRQLPKGTRLELFVKVDKNWQGSSKSLSRLGLMP